MTAAPAVEVVDAVIVDENEPRDAYPVGLLDGVELFMRTAGQAIADRPELPDDSTRCLRLDLLREEYREYVDAEAEDDETEILDGLLDVIVVAWGTALAYFGPDAVHAAAAEVTRSNLDKVLGEGLPKLNDAGKVLKPADWVAPDIAGVLAYYRQAGAQ